MKYLPSNVFSKYIFLLSLCLLMSCVDTSLNENTELKGTWQLKSIHYGQNQQLRFDGYTITFSANDEDYRSKGYITHSTLGEIPFLFEYMDRPGLNNLHINIDHQLFPYSQLNNTVLGYLIVYDMSLNKNKFVATASSSLIIQGNQREVLNYEFEKL